MKNKYKKRVSKFAVLLMTISFLITGCGSNKGVFSSYKAVIPSSDKQSKADGVYSQDYLSDNVCVIPAKKQSEPDPFMTAGASLIINDTSGKMVYSHNIYKKMYPASITKIVTALVTLKYANLDDTVTVSYNASHIEEYGAKLCGFNEGDKIILKDLLYSFLIYSGNDAGVAIAEHISGSVKEFAKLMNKEMKDLGAAGTHFVNPHGLHDKNHYTSAYDLYLVFHELLKYDTFKDIINQPYYEAKFKDSTGEDKKLSFSSTDKYLTGKAEIPEGVTVIGGKTGTTMMAGSNLILYSKDEQGNDYISIVMHAGSSGELYEQMSHLLDMED